MPPMRIGRTQAPPGQQETKKSTHSRTQSIRYIAGHIAQKSKGSRNGYEIEDGGRQARHMSHGPVHSRTNGSISPTESSLYRSQSGRLLYHEGDSPNQPSQATVEGTMAWILCVVNNSN